MTIKNEVLVRVYVVLFLLVLAGVIVFSQAIRIQIYEGEKWRTQGKNEFIKEKSIAAERGNILTEAGELLATSIPVFDVAFDPSSSGMSEANFKQNIDSLSYCLSTYVDSIMTPGGYRDMLVELRKNNKKYVQVKRDASYAEKEMMARFPLFKMGQFKGGFIANPKYRRERPFGILARRTIGAVRETANAVGLEGHFDQLLKGETGSRLMMMADRENDFWIPINDFETIEPKRGDDIVTSIDVDLQDITQKALLRAMNHHNAEWGTAVVLEVATGKIRSIANLGETDKGWWETYNYAVGRPIEPGSTFKLASMMALLEDGHVKNLDDTIFLNKGRMEFYKDEMKDSYPHSLDSASVRHAFEISSNVGIASLINQHYNQTKDASGNSIRKADDFIRRLKAFQLHLPTGIEIDGEARPYIKEAYNTADNWSGTTLPWMATGYELMLTPLQMLSFYNAVANNGTMMKPYLVTEIQHFGETKRKFKPTIVDASIASPTTIKNVKELLEGVVERGTARKLKTDNYRFAGKTGTAQVDYQRFKRGTSVGGYQASFAGYFPAENPIYSCIVVINKPRQNGFYGGDVAGPVFREIADRAFSTKVELQQPINQRRNVALKKRDLPNYDVGQQEEVDFILTELGQAHYGEARTGWAVLEANPGDSLLVLSRKMSRTLVPSVVGMGLRDAVYVLENRGLEVKIKGVGKVRKQSIKAGTTAKKQTITLTLG